MPRPPLNPSFTILWPFVVSAISRFHFQGLRLWVMMWTGMRALLGKLTHPGTKREQNLLRLKRDLFREEQGTNSHEVPNTR